MSKLDIKLSYKNACILKHALRNQIEQKESWINANRDGVYNTLDNEIKELEEEKRALQSFTEEINEFGYMHGRQVFGHEE
jgi:Fic family protein